MNHIDLIVKYYLDALVKIGMPEIENTSNWKEYLDNRGYKVQASQPDGSSVDIYSNGECEYDCAGFSLVVTLMRPHDKRWISKLVKDGVPVEFAKMQHIQFKNLHLQSQ